MKKLLIAASATACALGAFADISSGTSFEDLPVESALNVDAGDNGTLVTDGADKMWYTSDKTGLEAKVTAYGEAKPANRPAKFYSDANTKYLNIESTSAPLYRTVNAMSKDNLDSADKVDMGEVYIDTLVQFTAGDPEMAAEEAGAKLALWVCGNDADGNPAATTNFMVKAGCFDNGVFKSATYTMLPATDMTFEKDAWYRLTVKTIANVGADTLGTPYQGFVVFVGGVALKPQGYGQLASLTGGAYDNRFADAIVLSMVADNSKLAAVGFSGTGAIDDVTFTSEPPDFAADAQKFTLEWTEGVASITYGDVTIDMSDTDKSVELDVVVDKTIDVTYADGYVADWTASEIKAGATVVVKAIQGTCSYVVGDKTVYAATLADALAAAKGAAIKMITDATLDSTFGGGVTAISIDLNGCKLTASFGVEENCSLTIDDTSAGKNGELIAPVGSDGAVVISGEGAVVILNAGKYTGDVFVDGSEKYTMVIANGTKFTSDISEYIDVDTQELTKAEGDDYFTVKAKGDEPTVTPVKPGEDSVVVEAESAEEAADQVEITVPDAVAGQLTSEEEVAYKANFEKKVVANDNGTFTVEVVLTKAAEEAAQADADEAPAAALPAVVAAEGDTEVEIKGVVNGFFYSVESGTTLGDMKEGRRTMAKEGKVKLTFPKEANDKARFYKVKVNLGPNQN